MTGPRIWIERIAGTPAFAVRWDSGGMRRCRTCANENEARSFVAGFEEGLEEAQRLLSDYRPHYRDSRIQEPAP